MTGKLIHTIAAVLTALYVSGTANAAPNAKVPSIMTGTIVSATSTQGATCDTPRTALTGEGAKDLRTGDFGFIIAPDAAVTSGIAYQFLSFSKGGNMSYALPLIAFTGQGTYSVLGLTSTATTMKFTLVTTTGSQDGRATGNCKTRYKLNFTTGIPSQIKSFLKGLM